MVTKRSLRLGYGTGEQGCPTVGSRYRRLGDILLDEEMIAPAALEAAANQYASTEPQLLGSYLVRQNMITPEQLDLALELQGQNTGTQLEETAVDQQ